MGQIHPDGELAFSLLTEEGFEADDYIDIFDGGPILQAHKNALRSFRGSMVRRVATQDQDPGAPGTLVSYAVASSERKFRAIVLPCDPVESADAVCLPPAAREALGVAAGDSVVCVRI
jgi:arginine N-succinyltransferase